jgi:hypothetical protein
MYGVAVEYDVRTCGLPDPLERAACRAMLVRQPGFRRRLPLQADGWRRVVDLYLFDSPERVAAVLASGDWQRLAAAHAACRAAAPALLVSESPLGDLVVLLRGGPGPTRGGQACWRDHLAHAEPEAILW